MSHIVADRIKETTTTTGTGTVTLGGAATGYRAFSAVMANGDTTYYCIQGQGTSEWEVGYGTWNTGGTLSRTTIVASSNSGSAVNFSAGTKDVFGDWPAGALIGQYNVKAFGAKGDNSTNDGTAIQNAINAANADGGGIVFFPKGTYKLTAALNIYAGVNLQGVSELSSIINQTGTTVNALTLSDVAANYTQISNLTIQGPSSGSGIGIDLVRTTAGNNQAGVNLKDLIVKNFGSHGVWCTGAIISTFERVTSQGNGGDGFHIEQSGTNAGSTSFTFLNCYALTNTGKGYYIGQNAVSSYSSLISCAADSNDIGYYIVNIGSVGLYSCGAEGQTTASFKVDNSNHIVISNCLSSDCAGIDFLITGSSTKVTLTSTYALSAGVGHTAGVQVDSGSHAILMNHENSSSVVSAGDNIFTASVVQYDEKMPIKPRITTTASTATPAPNGDTTDYYRITALAAAAAFSDGTGAPVDGQKLIISVKDNGVSRALTWSGGFASSGLATLPTATPAGKTMNMGFIYDGTLTKWVLMVVDSTGY